MIHSEALLMSAIHVFHQDKMTAVAHLVVGDQLPLPDSVSASNQQTLSLFSLSVCLSLSLSLS